MGLKVGREEEMDGDRETDSRALGKSLQGFMFEVSKSLCDSQSLSVCLCTPGCLSL